MANMKVSPRLPVPSLQATAETADTTSASTLFSVMLSARRVIGCGVSDGIGKNSTTPRLQYRERLIAGTWYPECFYGLPRAIRTDNGVPFATTAIHGRSDLNVWWMRLGIQHQRIHPGCPQENDAHERMHRTLKRGAIRPARANLAAQQRAFNAFRQEYNEERPHGLDECDDGIWSVFFNTVLLAKLDERDLILRD